MTDPDIPAVRYLKAYTKDDPPPPLKTWWVRHNGTDLEILGRHEIPPLWADIPLDDLIPLGVQVVNHEDND